ncbi:hypothetical protein [Streptomyces sp. NPDC059828]|uniref:hypothetical protein n=1 Tax=Streptomyces sp. NPDC059828 TaxID=3346965 RepID=UPI00365F0F84
MNTYVEGYWCEVVAYYPDGGMEWFLGGYRATSPRLAVRWLRGQALRLANALDPIPGMGPLPPEALQEANPKAPNPGHILRKWAGDQRAQDWQMAELVDGRSFAVMSGGPDRLMGHSDLDLYYALEVRPMVRSFVTDWRLQEVTYVAA